MTISRIRKFRISDYDALIKLWEEAELSHRPKGRDSFKSIKRQTKFPYLNILVAIKDHKIIESVIGSHDGRRGWINRLAVHPDFRNKGITMRLVKEIEKWLHKAGIKIICVLIENWNKTSSRVFKRFGYTEHSDIVFFTRKKQTSITT